MNNAKATDDKDLMKKATFIAVLRSISPPVPLKPRRRFIKPGASIVVSSKMTSKNYLQITLLTNVTVALCRTPLKSGTCTSGIALKYDTLWECKKIDIPGSGEYIHITNLNLSKKVVVLIFKVTA